MKDDVYRLPSEEVCRQYGCDMEKGLSSEEARKRLERDGFNEFTRKKHTSLAVKFLNQFKSFMILVLIAAAAVSGIVGVMNGEGFTDVIIILAITVVNAIIGVFQETKAEKSLDALEQMSAPHCKVVRDGDVHVIATRELVKGDLVVIGTDSPERGRRAGVFRLRSGGKQEQYGVRLMRSHIRTRARNCNCCRERH